MQSFDDAAAWLDAMGFCLFLPRHAQLPAPAPSFVEACLGAGHAAPLPAAIDAGMDLVTRLVAEGRAVPLNLMGSFSEQPDFLATPEALRWVAAVRGDRQWKAAPAGRTAPIVVRVWETLDRSRSQTAAQIREHLGRELTEAAVLRALVELWTTLRAVPEYAAGEPTRWTLLRDRFPQELTAGANTAQPTALSALISLYLLQAVAATAEEAEIFLSPLTSRSRIREVLHGMLATRQFSTMALGVQTLLYIEGSLPEIAPEPETEEAPAPQPARAPSHPREERLGRRPAPPKESRGEQRREARPERKNFGRGQRPPFQPGQKREFRKPWQERGESRGQRQEGRPERGPASEPRQERGDKFRRDRGAGGWHAPKRPAGGDRLPSEQQPGEFRGRKPWRSDREPRSGFAGRDAGRGKEFRSGENRTAPGENRPGRGEGRPDRRGKPFGGKPFGRKSFGGKPFGAKPRFGKAAGAEKGSRPPDRGVKSRKPDWQAKTNRPASSGRPDRPGRPERPGRPGAPNRPGRSGRPDRPPRRFGKPKQGQRPGKPRAGRPGGKPREEKDKSE